MNTNYGGRPGMVNATINPPEMDKAIAVQKEASAAGIREHAKLSRHKTGKGTRNLKHVITEEVHNGGLTDKVKVVVNTARKNH